MGGRGVVLPALHLAMTGNDTSVPAHPLDITYTEQHPMIPLDGTLRIVPDTTTPGSSGRLCLQLPKEFDTQVGARYKQVGNFGDDGAALFIRSGEGRTLTPRRQIWWKNGVQDQRLKADWKVRVFPLEEMLFVVVLTVIIGLPKLPPVQETFF